MEFTVPQSWNELTPWQLPRIAKALFDPYKNVKTQQAYLLLVLFLKKPSIKALWRCVFLFRQVPLSTLKEHLEFLYKKDDLTVFPKIKGLAGPADRMTNCIIREYAYADAFYYNWTKRKQPIELERLAATLYRKKVNGIRPKFRLDQMPKYGKDLPKLNHGDLLAIMLAYQGTRKLLAATHKHVFKPGGSNTKYSSFSKIISDMASQAPQPFGDFYKTQEANVHDFLRILDHQLQDAKRNKS